MDAGNGFGKPKLRSNLLVLRSSLQPFRKLKHVLIQPMKFCRCHLPQTKDKPLHWRDCAHLISATIFRPPRTTRYRGCGSSQRQMNCRLKRITSSTMLRSNGLLIAAPIIRCTSRTHDPSQDLAYYGHRIPWAGRVILNIGEKAKVHPRVFRVVELIRPGLTFENQAPHGSVGNIHVIGRGRLTAAPLVHY